eukprot:422115-Lingulodinium_polyedra.AAC.1
MKFSCRPRRSRPPRARPSARQFGPGSFMVQDYTGVFSVFRLPPFGIGKSLQPPSTRSGSTLVPRGLSVGSIS